MTCSPFCVVSRNRDCAACSPSFFTLLSATTRISDLPSCLNERARCACDGDLLDCQTLTHTHTLTNHTFLLAVAMPFLIFFSQPRSSTAKSVLSGVCTDVCTPNRNRRYVQTLNACENGNCSGFRLNFPSEKL